MILLHVIIAVSSLAFACYTFFKPSKNLLDLIYALTGLTFITGFFLVFNKQAQMTQTCQTGLVYLGVILVGVVAIRYKLSKQIA